MPDVAAIPAAAPVTSQPLVPEVVPIVPEAVPPPPPPEPLDERGVPFRNVVADMRRKLDEQVQLNQQYQQVLGSKMQERQQPPPPDPLLAQFDEPTRRFVETVATRIADERANVIKHQTLSEMQIQQALAADPDLLPEARQQYAVIKSNPAWAAVSDNLTQEHAIAQAKSVLADRRRTAQQQTQTQQVTQQVARNQAAAAGLPGTGGALPPPPPSATDSRAEAWMAQPDKREMFKKFYPQMSLETPEGRAKFRRIADNAIAEMSVPR